MTAQDQGLSIISPVPLQGVSLRGILRKGISVVVCSSVVVDSTVVGVGDEVDEALPAEEAVVVFEPLDGASLEVEFDFPDELLFPSVFSPPFSGATPEMIAETPK